MPNTCEIARTVKFHVWREATQKEIDVEESNSFLKTIEELSSNCWYAIIDKEVFENISEVMKQHPAICEGFPLSPPTVGPCFSPEHAWVEAANVYLAWLKDLSHITILVQPGLKPGG